MMEEGPLAGFPVLDVGVELLSTEVSTRWTRQRSPSSWLRRARIRQSMPKAAPQLIEPIMKVDVFTPEDNVGDVIGDLNRRRGMIKDQEPTPTGVRVKADVPLAEMFGYIGRPPHHDLGSRPVLDGVLALPAMPQSGGREGYCRGESAPRSQGELISAVRIQNPGHAGVFYGHVVLMCSLLHALFGYGVWMRLVRTHRTCVLSSVLGRQS